MSHDNQHTKTWPGMEWPLPDEEAITEAVGGWLGFGPGDFEALSPCDPATAVPLDHTTHIAVAPEFTAALGHLRVVRKWPILRHLQLLESAPPLALVVASEDNEVVGWFARTTPQRDHAFFRRACRCGANARYWRLGFYALHPGDEFAGSRCFYFDNTKGGRA